MASVHAKNGSELAGVLHALASNVELSVEMERRVAHVMPDRRPQSGALLRVGAGHRARVARATKLIGTLIVSLGCSLAGGAASAGAMGSAGAGTADVGLNAAVARWPATITASPGEELFSPSMNISCELDWHYADLSAVAYCQTFTPLQSVKISPAGKIMKCSGVGCVGNPAINTPVLPYLTSIALGPFLCTSRVDGVACSAAGRAFLISRSGIASYNVLPHTTMAVYTDPASHPTLSVARGYGWLVALDRSGQYAELLVACGYSSTSKLPADRLWTVDLSAIKSFEVETRPADMTAGSVVRVSRTNWVGAARVNGWDGYMYLGPKNSLVTDGPSRSVCPA